MSSNPSNIARIDTHNTHGWQVRVTRHCRRHTKFFSDSRHGNSDKALEAAIVYRDQLLDELPEPLPGSLYSALARSKSGVPGLRLATDHGLPNIVVDTPTEEGGRKVVRFSVKRWGLRKALWKACSWKASLNGEEVQSTEVTRMYETAFPNIRKQLEDNRNRIKSEVAEGI